MKKLISLTPGKVLPYGTNTVLWYNTSGILSFLAAQDNPQSQAHRQVNMNIDARRLYRVASSKTLAGRRDIYRGVPTVAARLSRVREEPAISCFAPHRQRKSRRVV